MSITGTWTVRHWPKFQRRESCSCTGQLLKIYRYCKTSQFLYPLHMWTAMEKCHLISFTLFFFLLLIIQTFNTFPALQRCIKLLCNFGKSTAIYLGRHLSHIAWKLLPTRTFLPNEILSYASHPKRESSTAGEECCHLGIALVRGQKLLCRLWHSEHLH